jgi:type IV secretory pathway VirB9-like protein
MGWCFPWIFRRPRKKPNQREKQKQKQNKNKNKNKKTKELGREQKKVTENSPAWGWSSTGLI